MNCPFCIGTMVVIKMRDAVRGIPAYGWRCQDMRRSDGLAHRSTSTMAFRAQVLLGAYSGAGLLRDVVKDEIWNRHASLSALLKESL